MNKQKWTKQNFTRAEWFAKLAEEFGEVAIENSNMEFGRENQKRLLKLITELNHLELIAREFRSQMAEALAEMGVKQ